MKNLLQRIPLLGRFFETHKVATGGRWHLQYGRPAEFKANMSNEDHCGKCSGSTTDSQKRNEALIENPLDHAISSLVLANILLFFPAVPKYIWFS